MASYQLTSADSYSVMTKLIEDLQQQKTQLSSDLLALTAFTSQQVQALTAFTSQQVQPSASGMAVFQKC